MKLYAQTRNLGTFNSKSDFIKYYIFKHDQNMIKYSRYINCEKFLVEWEIFRYNFQTLNDGKIAVYEKINSKE